LANSIKGSSLASILITATSLLGSVPTTTALCSIVLSFANVTIGFAIPSNMVKTIASSLVKDGVVKRGYLGVSIGDLTNDTKEFYQNKSGALVMDVEEASPAAKAGLKRGDLIVAIDSKNISDSSDLRNKIGMLPPNTNISIKFIRDKKELITNATLKSIDESNPKAKDKDKEFFNGLSLQEVDGSVVVVSVEAGSKAAKKGFKINDSIIQVEDISITTIKELQSALSKNKGKKRVYVQRDNKTFLVICE
jgi:serine protease Do